VSRTDKDRKRHHLPEDEQPRIFHGGGDWQGINRYVNMYFTRPDRRRAKRACQLGQEYTRPHRHDGRWMYW
jgi:hypothetical protein